jgi:membrane fusion protein, multidrug efflux system
MLNAIWVLFAGLFFLAGCGSGNQDQNTGGQPPRPVETTTVVRQTMIESLLLVGSIAANESTAIRPEISGMVADIRFSEGDRVKQGQVLLSIDAREVRAELRDARARFELAEQELSRHESLFGNGFISAAELDRARAEHQRAGAEVERLQVRLDKAQVRAPFSGTVGMREISPGAYITPETIITRVDDLSSLKVDFFVPERHLARVRPGTPIRLPGHGPDGKEGNSRGEIYFASSSVDRATRAGQVRAIVKNPPPALRPGMFANIELILAQIDDALVVPESAVLSRPDGDFLLMVVEQDGESIVVFRPVRLGLRSRGIVQVMDMDGELEAGQTIIAAGVGALPLFPGAKVEPRPAKIRDLST